MGETVFKPSQSYSKEDLIKCSKGELFGQSNGKLPNNEMLMIDRISKINSYDGDFENGYLVGELDINPELWFFGCHFTGDPVCLLYTSPSPRDRTRSRMPSSA